MDILVRILAIFVEVLILAAIAYSILNGVRLSALDLGIGQRYSKALAMLLITVGLIVVIFFVAHLTSFYPAA